MKTWVLLTLLLLLTPVCFAQDQVLHASISQIKSVDPNYGENQKALSQHLKRFKGRYLYDYGYGYGVVDAEFTRGYYYYKNGQCFAFDDYLGATFPKKTQQYEYPSGRLLFTGVVYSPYHAELFTLDGQKAGEWNNNQCINADGSSCGNRQTYDLDEKSGK